MTHHFIAKALTCIASGALMLGAAACVTDGVDGDLSDADVSTDDSALVATISHVGTTSVYDSNGQGLTIDRPSGSTVGDLLVLALHRTDDYLPLVVSGWTRAAECFKQDNGFQCFKASDCASLQSGGKFCDSFGSSHLKGRDLAQAIFYKAVGSSEPKSYVINMNPDTSGEPGWAILTALRGAATSNPVRDWANKGCDNNAHALFPSVDGQTGDMLLLSQSFDDAIGKSVFTAPSGATAFGYVVGNDETGFLFGKRLTKSGETGAVATQGSGPPSQGQWCKDALISLTIKPKTL